MKRIPAVLISLLVLLTCPLALADMAGEIKAALQERVLQRQHAGVEVVKLDAKGNSRVIFSHNSDQPMTPASNMKVITTSAALDRLGPDFQFKTLLLLHDGDLVLIGDGDPTIGDLELYRKLKSNWDVATIFQIWGEQLKKLNINSIRNVIVDDSVFDENFAHPRWNQPIGKEFAAESGGVNLNTNCVNFYLRLNGMGQPVQYLLDPPTRYVSVKNTCASGGRNAVIIARAANSNAVNLEGQTNRNSTVPIMVAIHDPPMYAGTVLAETVAAAGINITGSVVRDRNIHLAYAKDPHGWTPVGVHRTALADVVKRANKDSLNLYAECLCKRLGHEDSGKPGSWENGCAAAGAFLNRIGVPSNQFQLDDGCGLSKHNAISASGMAKVLAYNYSSKTFPVFFNSLAVAGVDGTLENRFKAPYGDLRGRVFAKTGFVEGVSALSGYLKTRNGEWYAFSILINGIPHMSNSMVKVIHERIVCAIDRQN